MPVRRARTTERYTWLFVSIAATGGVVALLQQWLGFPPLVLLVMPIAFAVQMASFGLTAVAVASTALIGDYFFVEPLHEVTVHTLGLRLAVFLFLGAVSAWFIRARAGRGC